MVLKTEVISGEQGISSSGNHNAITQNNFNVGVFKPNRTVIFDLCMIISEAKITFGEYDIKKNEDWNKKLSFNNVSDYLEIFDMYCDVYDVFLEILETQYTSREVMIRKVNHLYKSVLIDYPDKILEGDFILNKIFALLKGIVACANYNVGNLIFEEEIDQSLVLIMFYSITKCKLLKIPGAE